MEHYTVAFFVTVAIALLTTYWQRKATKKWKPDEREFQTHYLVVYTLAYFADWLKGPYVYALYQSYGLTEEKIAFLFIVGFASSGISGPFVGGLADSLGRKRMTIVYFLIYMGSALCKPFQDYDILLLGRILGGIGTSLLTTTFESWMVSEHQKRKYSQELLDDTLSKATILNSASAITAGIIAQISVGYYGYIAPFMLAICPLTSGLFICLIFWTENKGQTSSSGSLSLKDASSVISTNLWILGGTQSLFLGAMYTFVFLWTPALSSDSVPHGLVFSTFMAMICIGTTIFKCFSAQVEILPYVIFVISAISCSLSAIFMGNNTIVFSSFMAFELACGIMFPTYGSLRSMYVPDEHRTTIMNIYRIPLNLFVVLVLVNKRFMSLKVVFGICCATHCISLFAWYFFRPEIKVLDGKEYELGKIRDEEEDFGNIEEELESDISDSDEIF